MRLRIVTSMYSSENQGKGETIDKPSFLKADCQLITEFLTFNIVDLLNVVFQGACMSPSDQKIILSQLKNSIQYRNIFFFLLFDKDSLLEICVCDAFIDKIQQFVLTFKLPIIIESQMSHIAISPIDSLHDFSFYIFG